MATTAQELVTRSWYLSGIVARNLQGVSGDQLTNGLNLLNDLLNFKQVETELLPYYSYDETVSCVVGQEKYFIEGCANIAELSFDLNSIRYKMTYVHNDNYFGQTRLNTLTTLPFTYTFIRATGGLDLYLYPLPQSNYNLNIYGQFYLENVTAQTDLETVFDKAYIEYLRYALAQYMCSEYGIIFNPQSQKILEQYKRKLLYMSPPDVTTDKMGMDQGTASNGWTFIQFFNGWVP